MNAIDRIEPWMLVALVLGVLALIAVMRATAKTVQKTRQVSRTGRNVLRTLLGTAAIGGVQWLILTNATDWRVIAVVLAVPAFVTSARVVRTLTVTTTEHAHAKGGKR
ncbi:hypothetical protein ACFWNN_21920 [Lentzea sp. NPDC058450]|uniref:hypothetical protein n=1 Tax=Lentzea sp. NPDC058450 TaxID=3346505 RepID=UPI003664B76E